jgi:hypothetical protein
MDFLLNLQPEVSSINAAIYSDSDSSEEDPCFECSSGIDSIDKYGYYPESIKKRLDCVYCMTCDKIRRQIINIAFRFAPMIVLKNCTSKNSK